MYNSEPFKEAWNMWKKHKQEQSGFPLTETSEASALSDLFWRTHGKEDLAIESIKHSLQGNWARIYLKTKNNNGTNFKSTNGNGSQLSSTAIIEADRPFNPSL